MVFLFYQSYKKTGEKNKTAIMKITNSNLLGISLLFTQKVIIFIKRAVVCGDTDNLLL
jgi:hypothetical protein